VREVNHVGVIERTGEALLGLGLVDRVGHTRKNASDGRFRLTGFPASVGSVLTPPSLPAPLVKEDPVNLLVRQRLPPLVQITPSTGLPTWQGEKPDYEWMGRCHGSLSSREEL
jgi:hypothetical protein